MSLHKKCLRGDVVKHVCDYCTGEMVGYIIITESGEILLHQCQKSSEQNQLSRTVDLLDRFIMFCTVCLAYLMLYSGILLF